MNRVVAKLSADNKLPFVLCFLGLAVFAIVFSYDVWSLQYRLDHNEFAHYYYGFRHWFLGEVSAGRFPAWNPYWGIGHSTEVGATIPLDIYSLLELVFGPRYHLFYPAQLALILAAALVAFSFLGASVWTATLGALLFLLSPWVVYFSFYFLTINSFIGLALSSAFAYSWLSTGKWRHLIFLALACSFAMQGTKLEFWFFHYGFLGMLGVIAWPAMRYHGVPVPAVRWLGYGATLGLSLLGQSWQLLPLLYIVGETDRLSYYSGLRYLFGSEMYLKLFVSVLQSDFLRAAVLGFFSFLAWKREGATRILAIACTITLFYVLRSWEHPPLRELGRPQSIGAAVGILLGLLRTRSPRAALKAISLFLPLSYYWLRSGESDLQELLLLHRQTGAMAMMIGGLVALGCFEVSRHPLGTIVYCLLLCLFVVRDQGQIVMSYLAGMVWIPTRDNYLFDWLFSCLAVLGLSGLPKRWATSAAVVGIATIIVVTPVRVGWYHPLMRPAPTGWPAYDGKPEIREVLSRLKDSPTWRGYFVDERDLSPFAPSLAEKAPQVLMFSSLPNRRYKEWCTYRALGIRPEAHWSAFPADYTSQTVAKLPRRNLLGYSNHFTYWHTVANYPPSNFGALRELGVSHLISSRPLAPAPELSEHRTWGRFHTARLKSPLPRAFTIPRLSGRELAEFQAELSPRIDERSLAIGARAHAFEPVPISDYRPEQVTLHVTTSRPSTLVLTDLYHPFWKVEIDGEPAELFPALHLFRGVHLPTGTHRIEFRAAIPFFPAACAVSALVHFFLLFCLVRSLRARPSFGRRRLFDLDRHLTSEPST